MFAAFRILLIIGILLKCGYGQIVTGGYGASPYGGGGGGVFVIGLLPLLFIGYILLKSQLEEALENSCEALFQDVEITATKTVAVKDCEECTDHDDKGDCNKDPNCDYEDGTCFASGDYTAKQTCCSYFFSGMDAEKCQACVAIKTAAACTTAPCQWIAATGKCFHEV